jgi:hypothetical protein
MTLFPIERCHCRPELARERVGSLPRSVDEANLASAPLDEAVDDRPRSAPAADDDGRSGVRTPTRLLLKDVPRETVDVVVRAPERSIGPYDDAANRPNPPRRVVDLVNDRKRMFLVGDRQVAAGKAERRKRPKRWLQTFRRDRERNVGPGEAVLLEEVIVEGR